MFFTTNPPSPEQVDPDLIEAIANLNTGKRSAADVLKLSDIDRSSALGVMPAFRELPDEARRFAVREMLEQSEANVQLSFNRVLRHLLSDPDAEVRTLVVQGMWEDDSTTHLDELLDMLVTERESVVREEIAAALGHFSYLASIDELDDQYADRVRDILIDLYYSDEPLGVRKRALESVAYFDDDEVEAAIDEAFESIFHDLRIAAIFAMGRNLSDRWFSVVLGEMEDSDPEIRFEAARASGEFGDERAVNILLDLLNDEDPEVQMAAVGALGQIGGKVAVGALRRLARSDDPILSDSAQDALGMATVSNDPLRLSP